MSWGAVLALMFGSKVGLLLTALPVAFVFFVINIVGSYLIFGGLPGLEQMVRNEQLSVAQFSLVPIPLFVLMGEVLFHTGLAMKSIDAVDAVIRRVPGRLAVVTLVAGTIFSAISGSTIATTASSARCCCRKCWSAATSPRPPWDRSSPSAASTF
jgi:TRAP-type mannitol/chloroaromatic compound transport system permease large subunit